MPPVKKGTDADGSVDRIGALPDGILHHLLSFLPAQEAVRTCVLARRWRHLWKSTTGLRIVGTRGPGSVQDLHKFVDHLLILRDRTDLGTVEIRFSKFCEADVPLVNLWTRFAVQCKVRELTIQCGIIRTPLYLDGLPLVSRYLKALDLYALEDLKICFSAISVGKISSRSLKKLKVFYCRSFLFHLVHVCAPCTISLEVVGFSGRTPFLESMPSLETAYLKLGDTAYGTPHDICANYHTSRGFCGAHHDGCVTCRANDDASINCVVLGAISNAKDLELRSLSGMIIFARDLKWCPTFNKLNNFLLDEYWCLKTLLLNDYWCVGPDFDALTCILKHSPVLEKLTLQLVPKGQAHKVEMKGSYCLMERSSAISEQLKMIYVKCDVVDESVLHLLKFMCTLNILSLL
ncbi:hypothetical protein BRADI_4g22904v3 [Brachypodium distachyon]|uniref:F-box domain-containing protein n=1 Tax=Brachypodium distachyon TaxID=15368 RepID=A0A0Q3ERV5_BRADI|nr:hypothetical protein BRADI_4g22904v3 [Brachypodium distachyon]